MEKKEMGLEDYLELTKKILKRWKFILIFTFAIGIVVTIVAFKLKHVYESTTTIILNAPPGSATSSDAIRTNVSQKLQIIKKLISGRTNLEQIIADMDLYPVLRKSMPMEEIVGLMARNIDIKVVGQFAFTLSFFSENQRIARDVCNRVADNFIKDSIQTESSAVSRQRIFYENQLAQLKKKLDEVEKKVMDFKKAHAGEMPEDKESLLTDQSNIHRRLKTVETTIRELEDKLEKQGVRPVDGVYYVPNVTKGPDKPDENEKLLGANQIKLATVKAQLSEMLKTKTKEHPEVSVVVQEIANLESTVAQLKKLVAASRAKKAREVVPPAKVVIPAPGTTPAKTAGLNKKQNRLTQEIEEYKKEKISINDQLVVIKKALKNIPRVAREFTSINRNYSEIKNQYARINALTLRAELEESQTKSHQGFVFEIKDKANYPESPARPKKKLIVLGGFIFGFLFALGLVYANILFKGTISNERDIQKITDVPVYISISRLDGKG